MTDSQHETLLAAWLENRLTEQQRAQFEYLCTTDDAFARQVEKANALADIADNYPTFGVPEWNRQATFTAPAKSHWWQWQGLPAASMAMSALALVMVVTGFRIDVGDGKLSMGFGSQPDGEQIAAIIDTKVQQYQQANQQLFSQYTEALARQQQQSSAELTEYLLTSSRQERREDFAELIKFINEQRTDDQRFYARQLNHLKQEITAIETGQGAPVAPYNGPSDDE